MPESSVIFAPEMDEGQLDSEVGKIDESLDDLDTQIHPEIDDSQLQDIGPDGITGVSGGGASGRGSGATAGALAGLSSRIPASVSAGSAGAAAAAAALPVALAGGGFFALKNIEQGLAKASPALGQVNEMFSQAIQQFRAPFGRALAEELRPGAQTLLEAGTEFRQMASERGLETAIKELGTGFFGDIRKELVTRDEGESLVDDIIDDVTAAGQGGAVLGGIFGGQIGSQIGGALSAGLTLVMEPLLQPLTHLEGLGDFVKDPMDSLGWPGWPDSLTDFPGWPDLDINVSDILRGPIGLGPMDLLSGTVNIGPTDLIPSPPGPLDIVSALVEGTITGGDVLDEFLGGGGGGTGTGGSNPTVDIGNEPVDVNVRNGLSRPPIDRRPRDRPPRDGGGDDGFFDGLLGGGLEPSDLDYIEDLLFDIRRELRDLNRQDSDFYIDGERIARATDESRQSGVTDTNPLI